LSAASDVDVEVAPLEERRADLLQLTIPPDSKLAGVTVRELRLPPNVIIALIMRGEESFSPDGHTLLRVGDDLMVIAPADLRQEVEDRFIAIGRGGRLAKWKHEEED
jgi:cell volume regulation protein A